MGRGWGEGVERVWRGCGKGVWRGCGEGCVERVWRGGVEKVGRGCGEGGGAFSMGYKQVQVALFTHVRLISSIFQARLLRAISC